MQKYYVIFPFFLSLFFLFSPSDCSELPQFSFALIADPHITVEAEENQEKLERIIKWINENYGENRIELAIVVGDIGWPGNGQARAKSILDQLEIPYIPLIGDNEIQFSSAEEFYNSFQSQYHFLNEIMENWNFNEPLARDPITGEECYFINFSFDYRGLHFLALDWATRIIGGWESEQAELWNFPGGSFDFFQRDIALRKRDFEKIQKFWIQILA